jgi:hypothetical protein
MGVKNTVVLVLLESLLFLVERVDMWTPAQAIKNIPHVRANVRATSR